MAVYIITRNPAETSNSSLGNRISKRFPGAHYVLGKGRWLVATELSVQRLCEELKIEKGSVYTGTLVAKVSNYYGLHSKKLWDWLKEHTPEEDD
jgi:hypothetical protein